MTKREWKNLILYLESAFIIIAGIFGIFHYSQAASYTAHWNSGSSNYTFDSSPNGNPNLYFQCSNLTSYGTIIYNGSVGGGVYLNSVIIPDNEFTSLDGVSYIQMTWRSTNVFQYASTGGNNYQNTFDFRFGLSSPIQIVYCGDTMTFYSSEGEVPNYNISFDAPLNGTSTLVGEGTQYWPMLVSGLTANTTYQIQVQYSNGNNTYTDTDNFSIPTSTATVYIPITHSINPYPPLIYRDWNITATLYSVPGPVSLDFATTSLRVYANQYVKNQVESTSTPISTNNTFNNYLNNILGTTTWKYNTTTQTWETSTEGIFASNASICDTPEASFFGVNWSAFACWLLYPTESSQTYFKNNLITLTGVFPFSVIGQTVNETLKNVTSTDTSYSLTLSSVGNIIPQTTLLSSSTLSNLVGSENKEKIFTALKAVIWTSFGIASVALII